jgi:RND family efflux transporter MFP subunit
MKSVATLFLSLAFLSMTGAWLASSSETEFADETHDRSALPVTTTQLQPISSVNRDRQFTGMVVAARSSSSSQLAFERPARLLKVLCDEGQNVTSGQTLAAIDQRQLLAQITELEAGIQQQNAILDELNEGPRSEVIASTEADLAALTADVELQRATFNRTQGLFDRRATSAQALDEVRLAWKAAVAKQEAVARKRDELMAGTRKEKLAAQEAVVAGLAAKLEQLQIDVLDSELKAPFSGTIVKRFADEGDMLNPQQPVLELLETSKLEAKIGVPSEFISSLNREGYVVLKSGQIQVTGRIRDVIAQVDPTTRTQTVVIDIDNAAECGLADGSLIRLAFTETKSMDGFRVPLTALTAGSRGLWSAYILETATDDPSQTTIAARAVEVVHTDGETAVVRGAIYEGERIVMAGVHRVVPGQRVTDTPAATKKD